MNKVILIGRVTADLEVKELENDKKVVRFFMAVDRGYKNGGADFIPVVAWNKTAELLGNYVGKGSQLGVCGRVNVRNYEYEEGKKRNVVEIIADEVQFLGRIGNKAEASEEKPVNVEEMFKQQGFTEVDGDDMPF